MVKLDSKEPKKTFTYHQKHEFPTMNQEERSRVRTFTIFSGGNSRK
jgi:hypothetical protein